MRIGSVDIPHGLILAPMAGFTDHAMRAVCSRHGAEYTVCEMVSAKAIVYGDRKTLVLARIRSDESPCAIQIFGSDPQICAEAAHRLSNGVPNGLPPVAIDINMGCPVPKIFGNGEGSALMRDPDRIHRIVRAVCDATAHPVTAKIRAGIDDAHINAVECGLAIEEAGAAAIAVHGRTRAQLYSGTADRAVIRAVKEAVRIPVVANGDVTDPNAALSMLRETGADGCMIARAAIGNPFIFEEIRAAMDGISYTPPTLSERLTTALTQLSLAIEEKGETVAVREARKQIALYLRGFRGAAQVRGAINAASTFEEVKRAFACIDVSADAP